MGKAVAKDDQLLVRMVVTPEKEGREQLPRASLEQNLPSRDKC